MSLLVNRASMTGMLVFDYASRYPEAMREMGRATESRPRRCGGVRYHDQGADP
jgi:hypothetical protein